VNDKDAPKGAFAEAADEAITQTEITGMAPIEQPYAHAAGDYWRAGWQPLPVDPEMRVPTGYTGAHDRSVSWPDLQAWTTNGYASANVGVRLVCMVGIDVDAYDGKGGAETLAAAEAELGALPTTHTSTSRGPGQPSRIHFYRLPVGVSMAGAQTRLAARFGKHVDVLHHGHRYALVWPSVGKRTGALVRWYAPGGAVTAGMPAPSDCPWLPQAWQDFLSADASTDLRNEETFLTGFTGVRAGDFGPAPQWVGTREEAWREVTRCLDVVAAAGAGEVMQEVITGQALRIGHFAGVFGAEFLRERMLYALALGGWHSDAWNVANGKSWTAGAEIDRKFRQAAGEWQATVETEVPGAAPGQFPAVAGAPGAATVDVVAALRAELLDSEALEALPEPVPLVDGYLYRDTVGAVIGKSGDGKSHVMLDLAGAVGGGTAWHGREVPSGELVWCIVAEGASGMRKRARAWEKHHGRRLTGVRFLPRPVQAGGPEWAVLVELARQDRPGLVFLDTLARITVGMEENSNTEMGVLIDRMERLRAAAGGACVMAVHHLGHSGDQGRGASALKGAWTTELRVRKEARVGGGWTVVVETSKVKDGAEAEPLALEMRVVPLGVDAGGRTVDSVVLVADALTEAGLGGAKPASGRWAELYAELPASRLALIDALDNVFPVNGATKAELLRAVVAGRKMSRPTFDRAWDDLVAREVLARIEGTQRYKLAHLNVITEGPSNVEA